MAMAGRVLQVERLSLVWTLCRAVVETGLRDKARRLRQHGLNPIAREVALPSKRGISKPYVTTRRESDGGCLSFRPPFLGRQLPLSVAG